MSVRLARALGLALATQLAACGMGAPRPPGDRDVPPRPLRVAVPPETTFARLVERLSEPGGFFDSDNIISNETSYLHVLDAMQRLPVRGGIYLGVGPDQNFSYIAAVRPAMALMIDIRRDNLLEHLLFKALFAMSANRVEYLANLLGRPAPRDAARWDGRSIDQLVEYFDATPADSSLVRANRARIDAAVRDFGIPLSSVDLETIHRVHDAFIDASLSLRYSSLGRAPRPYHPTYRMLLLERDRAGRQASFLAHEDDYQFVRSMEARGLVVPVVGNLAGDRAMREVARFVAERGERISAFYVSNVEQYLMRDGSFSRFAENVKLLPHDERSVIIRSFFNAPFGSAHPLNVPGHASTQLLQTIDSFAAEYDRGMLRTYYDLVGRNFLDP